MQIKYFYVPGEIVLGNIRIFYNGLDDLKFFKFDKGRSLDVGLFFVSISVEFFQYLGF